MKKDNQRYVPTPAERKASERLRKRDKGLVQVTVWIKPQYRENLMQYVDGVNRK